MIDELTCGERTLSLRRPVVMGVLNITPDSFSDGGELFADGAPRIDHIVAVARSMASDGAAILDVGGESTRPGAEPVTEQQELDRVCPVIEHLARDLDLVISVDTSTPAVMREAVAAGAGIINDVRALQREGALEAAAQLGRPVCLMHMQGEPGTMQRDPHYEDVTAEVAQFLAERVAAAVAAGLERDTMLIDPGFGFGKSVTHNLTLLNRLDRLETLDLPILVGLSRKSTIGVVLGREVDERLYGSVAAAVVALTRGARIFRVHDVAATADALAMADAVLKERSGE